MRLFPGDDVPDLSALAQEMPEPWLMPRGLSRAHRDRLGTMVVRTVRRFDPRIQAVQLRWAEVSHLREGRLRLPERVLVWWRSDEPADDPAEVLHEAPRLVRGLHLLDLDRDPGSVSLGWLGPLKVRLLHTLTDALLERVRDVDVELLIDGLNDAAERLVSPIDLLDFAETLVEARSAGASLAEAREEAIAAVLTGHVAWETPPASNMSAWHPTFHDAATPARLPPIMADLLGARGLAEGERGPYSPLLDWLAVPGVQERVTEHLRRQAAVSGEEQSLAIRAAASAREHFRLWFGGRTSQESAVAALSPSRARRFVLDVATDPARRRVTLRLHNEHGALRATHEVALDAHPPALWAGLFDTRRYVARTRDVEAPEALLARLGRFLGEQVLGPEIARELAAGLEPRTLLVQVPDSYPRRPRRLVRPRALGDGAGARRRPDAARAQGDGPRGPGRCEARARDRDRAGAGTAGPGAAGVRGGARIEARGGAAGAGAAPGFVLRRGAPEARRGGRRALPRGDPEPAAGAGAGAGRLPRGALERARGR